MSCRFWEELHGDKRVEAYLLFLFFQSYEAATEAALLTEAPLFGAYKGAVRQAKGPLSYKVEEKKKPNNPFIQLFGPAIWTAACH